MEGLIRLQEGMPVFGTNPLTKQRPGDGDTLAVQSIFSTLQGEGPYAGQPAIFLRLAGCNLRCFFCDTDFESKRTEWDEMELAREIVLFHAVKDKLRSTKLVVITGGEPLLQNIVPLVRRLTLDHGMQVQIETAGTVWIDGLEKFCNLGACTIVCSPKTGSVHPMIEEHCGDWKYLIRSGETSPGDGLPIMSTQIKGKEQKLYRPPGRIHDTVWLQPCEEYKVGYRTINIAKDPEAPLADQEITSSIRDEEKSRENVILARDAAMKYNYRLSVQLHKLVGLP